MINLHYWPTPNGKKVTILLEEAGIPYNIVPVNIGRGDQFTPEFLKMNPNHRMPVMVDNAPTGGGEPIAIFESGAIMLYLAEKVGRFYPQDIRGKYAVTEWLIWQMANQGPKLGECGHFRRLGEKQGDQSYAIRRFTDEANRLYGVMNNRLHESKYLARPCNAAWPSVPNYQRTYRNCRPRNRNAVPGSCTTSARVQSRQCECGRSVSVVAWSDPAVHIQICLTVTTRHKDIRHGRIGMLLRLLQPLDLFCL